MAGLQRATLNLLLHNPKKIFITNVNFFLNLNYKKNYSNNMNIFKNKGVLRSFMNHDPLYQFLIIKNLFKKKLISVDKQIRQILALPNSTYMKKLEKNYFEIDFK